MFTAIAITHVWVLDQDQALDFYVDKLGFEVGTDVDLGMMRWLTVRVPGTEGPEILLERIGPPSADPDSAEKLRELITKGVSGLAFSLATDDCRKTYETLRDRGVEFLEEPTERSYGIDCGARDPFGNHFRIVQRMPFDPDKPHG